MVKLKGPALSLEATGSIGKSITLSTNKGRAYMRALRKPAQPRTSKQISARTAVRFCSETWAGLISVYQSSWNAEAARRNLAPFHCYVAGNTSRIRNDKAPAVNFLAGESDAIAAGFTWSMTGSVRRVTYTFHPNAPVNQNWGALLYQHDTHITTCTPEILVGFFVTTGTVEVTWVYTPLVPATYYARIRLFSRLGVLGAQSGQRSAIVLDA